MTTHPSNVIVSNVIVHKERDKERDMDLAERLEIGMVDQGVIIEDTVAGLREATKLYLEEFRSTLT